MNLARRKFLYVAGSTAVLLAMSLTARPQSSAHRSTLAAGEVLNVNDVLVSNNGANVAMLDSGCNVTLLNGGTPVWRSSHSIPAQGPCFATIQTDGNFVIYLGTPQQRGIALWSSGTFGPSPLPFFLTLQDDGKLVIYKGAATWATGTKGLVAPGPGPWTNRSTLAAGQVLTAPVSLPSPSGEYVAIMQSDGNFVIRETHGNLLLWNSGTALGRGNFFAAMQTDGLVVLYKGTPEQGGSAYWVSGTFNPFPLPFFLTMQDDGNLVIYRGNSIWSQPGS